MGSLLLALVGLVVFACADETRMTYEELQETVEAYKHENLALKASLKATNKAQAATAPPKADIQAQLDDAPSVSEAVLPILPQKALGEVARGFFSALQTSGSFVMQGAGGFEKDKLGEGTAFDPAMCAPDGLLQCPNNAACKDSDQAKTMKYYTSNLGGKCATFKTDTASAGRLQRTQRWPGNHGNWVLAKPFVGHPNSISANTGVWGFKRTVCKTGKCYVFKVGHCVTCKDSTGFTFGSEQQQAGTIAKLTEFMKTCANKAFESTGAVKASFACNSKDAQVAQHFIMMQ